MFILNRYYKFYKYNGLIKTITKILTTPYRIFKKYIYQKNKEIIFLLSINLIPIGLVLATSIIMGAEIRTMWTVSYTHLTLPTTCSV